MRTPSSPALPGLVESVEVDHIDYDGNYGNTRVCVVAQLQHNPWHDLRDLHGLHDFHHLRGLHPSCPLIDSQLPQLLSYPAFLLPSTSLSTPLHPIHHYHPRPSFTQHDAYEADEEDEADDEERGTLPSPIPSLTTASTTMSTSGLAGPSGKYPTFPRRWPTKGSSMPTLLGRRSSFSSKIHTLLHPPSTDDRSSPEAASPHIPIPSPYTTASSTEEDYTTGSDDFFATSPQVLRLDEHDSFLLDDDPDPFANYLSRARSSSSIDSSPSDHTHTRTYPLSATATAVPTRTQPERFLTLVPTFTSRAQKRFSSTGLPTLNGSIRRQRLFTRPSLPSLAELAQKFGASSGPNLPTTNEHVALDSPIPLPPRPFMARFPADPWQQSDWEIAPTSPSISVPSVIGGRRRRREVVGVGANANHHPVVWNAHMSVNTYPRLPFSGDPKANVTHRPGAASSDHGTSSFVAGSGSGSSRQHQQDHAARSNQRSSSQYSGAGMGGGGGTGGRGGGGGSGGGGGGDRSDGGRGRKPRGPKGAKPDHSSTDAHTTTATEDEKNGTHRGTGNSSGSGNGTTDSDDTPLARRLPGALTAQKSLRRLVREGRDVQRQVRAREQAKNAPRQPAPPSRGAEGSGAGSVPADELTKKLLKVQIQVQSSSPLPPLSHEPTSLIGSPAHIEQHASTSTSTFNKYAFAATPSRPHWSEAYPLNKTGGDSSDCHYSHTNPVARPNNTSQRNTVGNMPPFLQFPHSPYPPQQQQQQQQHQAPHSLQRAATSATSQLRPRSNRPSHEMPEPRQRTETLHTLPVRQRANTLSSPASSRPTTSSTSASTPTAPAIPPLPTTTHAPTHAPPVPTLPGRGFAHAGEGGPTMQQRVFVGDMQHFSIVSIGHGTKARDVIAMVDENGELPHEAKAGGWMLFELSNDFGMGESLESLLVSLLLLWGKEY
jgi:hypothetical protein